MERLAITNIAHHHKNNLIAIIAATAIIQSYSQCDWLIEEREKWETQLERGGLRNI